MARMLMRRHILVATLSVLVAGSPSFGASLGSPAHDFRADLGAPSWEEHLVRTSTLRWKPLRSRDSALLAARASALETSSLDGRVCAVAIWCERRLSNADTAHLAQRFFSRRYRAADFAKPLHPGPSRIYKLSHGGTVLVNEHGKQDVVVIGDNCYWRNLDIFDGEAAKVRPPTSEP
jgi:hypothetical protein